MTDASFDARAYRLARIASQTGRFSWHSSDVPKGERSAWQVDFRSAFSAALGNLSAWERPPLDAQVLQVRQFDGYRREKIAFMSRPGLRACGYFLIPDAMTSPRPAIVCFPGHGRGVDLCVGIATDGSQRPLGAPDEYSADFALACVAHGYPTLALETIGFGERCDHDLQLLRADATSCVRDSMAALMLGETLAGWRVWDGMRAIDYLQTREDVVEPGSIGVMGISGGGLVALFLAAIDKRVTAAIVSCYFNTFADSVLAVDHCVDNFVPGLLALCEMPDLAALIAPRALFVEGGHEDPIFPHRGFERAVAHARSIYESFDAVDAFGFQEFDGGHRFHGTRAFEFLRRTMPAN